MVRLLVTFLWTFLTAQSVLTLAKFLAAFREPCVSLRMCHHSVSLRMWLCPEYLLHCLPLAHPSAPAPCTECSCSHKHALIPPGRENHFLLLGSLLSHMSLPRRNCHSDGLVFSWCCHTSDPQILWGGTMSYLSFYCHCCSQWWSQMGCSIIVC